MSQFSKHLAIALLIATLSLGSTASAMIGTHYKLMSKLLGDSDPDQYKLSWNSVFGTGEDDYGQDLYLQIYNVSLNQPERSAVKEIAQSNGLSLTETEQVLNGTLSPLLNSQKNIGTFSQEDALRIAEKIQRDFDQSFALKELKGEFDAQNVPTEIFANGDISDSGFDLLFDLDTIEYYLFIDKTPNVVNQTIPNGSKGYKPLPVTLDHPQNNYTTYDSGLASGGSNNNSNGNSTVANNSNVSNSGSSSAQSSSSSGGSSGGSSGTSGSSGSSSSQDPNLTNNFCPADPTLNDAIDDFDNIPPASDDGNKNKPPENNPSGSSGSSPSGSKPDNNDTGGQSPQTNFDDSGNSSDNSQGSTPATSSLSPAPADFPVDPSLCEDLKSDFILIPRFEYETNVNNKAIASFCFGISTESANYSSFYPTKPCISCTVAKINESMKQTVSHSLIPNKLTGNLFESAKCKEGVSLSDTFDMNIFLIPMPILTPPKYSEYEGHNIAKEFELFSRKYLPFTVGREKQSLPQQDEETSVYNQAFQQCLSMSPDDITQTELLDCTSQTVSIQKGEQRAALQEAIDSVNIKVTVDFYQPVAKELDRMLAFFTGFREGFQTTDNICRGLNNKPSE